MKNYTKILFHKYYIIDNLKSKTLCLNNTTNNICCISKSRVYKNTCQEPIYKTMSVYVLI